MYIFILRLLLGRCVSNGPFSRAQLLKKGEKKIKRFLFFTPETILSHSRKKKKKNKAAIPQMTLEKLSRGVT
jgi:hypothetical protein